MKKSISIQAWDYIRDELDDLIIGGNYTEINFIWQLEWELCLSQPLTDYIKNNKIKLNVVSCIGEAQWLANDLIAKQIPRELIHAEVWPSFWFLRSHHSMLCENFDVYNNLDNTKYKFEYPFITLNGRWRDYRTWFIDELAKNNYIEHGIVSYHQIGKNLGATEPKFYNDAVLTISDGFEEIASSYKFNDLYTKSFLHLPTESTLSAFILSEKTAMPILCKKLFLTLGCPRYHEKLQRVLGIEPYTEIFDYSFDKEIDTQKRIEKMMVNVQFVLDNRHRLDELYAKVKDKVDRNYRRAMQFVQRYDTIPPMIKKYYDQISKPDARIKGFDKELLNMSVYFKDKTIPNSDITTYRTQKIYYDLWDSFDFEKIVLDITHIRPEKIVILGENEWDPWFTPEFVKAINQSDTQFLYITGAKESDYIKSKFEKAGIKNYSLQYWPTFWFNYSEQALSTPDHRNYTAKTDFKYPFISLNNRGHIHRLKYLDEMAKRNLLDKGIVTWHDIHNENKHIELKHFDRDTRLKINDDFDTKLDSFIVPDQFHDSLFDFVTECCYETIMFSEKTAIPLLLRKPFAVLSAPYYHKFLTDLGFKLYDEIIDYSFDSELDLEKRITLFVNNIEKVSKITDLTAVYETLREKIEFNYYHYYDVMKNIDLIPKEVRTVITTTPENENIQVSSYQRKYRELIKRMKTPFLQQ